MLWFRMLWLILAEGNMNGGSPYLIANPNSRSKTQFNTDYSSRQGVEYFELYAGPITTRYGQVFWQGLPEVSLPADLVQRFDGKTIAIVGYEEDQVIRTDNKPDISVPINAVYNHHYVAWLKGKHASMVKLDGSNTKMTGHPLLMQAYALNDPNPDSVIPTSQFFSEGNGGESRKSYHGYPKGMAQLLDSPTSFVMTPMQIDTWNRNRSMFDAFVPGPESSASAAPLTGPDAVYSGHLECPCTDRILKTSITTFGSQVVGHCGNIVNNATLCFEGAMQVFGSKNITTNITSSTNLPSGCSVVTTNTTTGAITAYFNNNTSTAAICGIGGSGKVYGSTSALITFSLHLDPTQPGGMATLTLTGPDNVWFGVGLGAQQMSDTPNAIIVLGNGTVFEQKLGNQQAGSLLPLSLTILSNTCQDGKRIVVVTRPFLGKTPNHFSFDPTASSLHFINAIGKTSDFSYHQARGPSVLNLFSMDGATCVCDLGTLDYISSDQNPELQPFRKSCTPEPGGDLIQLKNPTCWLNTYKGGLACCTNGNILLDKTQNPWANDLLTFYTKWRFYFEEFTNSSSSSSHQNLVRFFHDAGGAGEHDIVKAAVGTAPEDTVYQLTTHLQVKDGVDMCDARTSPHCAGPALSGINLVYASGHCHAPSCLKMEIWNADTGMLICRQTPVYGTSEAATPENPYDEKGFLAIPPCLFGSEDEGLLPSPYLSYDTNLTFVKWNNNTYDHYGDMGMWQMRGYQAYDPNATKSNA